MFISHYSEEEFFEEGLFNIPRKNSLDESQEYLMIIYEPTACRSLAFGTDEILEAFCFYRDKKHSDYRYYYKELRKLCKINLAERHLYEAILTPSIIYTRRFDFDEENLVEIILTIDERINGYGISESVFNSQLKRLSEELSNMRIQTSDADRKIRQLKSDVNDSEKKYRDEIALAQFRQAELENENAGLRALLSSKERAGEVYLLQTSTGIYKIGRAKDTKKRMKAFAGLPFRVIIKHIIQTEDMFELEIRLHQRFESKRVNGEWFALESEDVTYICSIEGSGE